MNRVGAMVIAVVLTLGFLLAPPAGAQEEWTADDLKVAAAIGIERMGDVVAAENMDPFGGGTVDGPVGGYDLTGFGASTVAISGPELVSLLEAGSLAGGVETLASGDGPFFESVLRVGLTLAGANQFVDGCTGYQDVTVYTGGRADLPVFGIAPGLVKDPSEGFNTLTRAPACQEGVNIFGFGQALDDGSGADFGNPNGILRTVVDDQFITGVFTVDATATTAVAIATTDGDGPIRFQATEAIGFDPADPITLQEVRDRADDPEIVRICEQLAAAAPPVPVEAEQLAAEPPPEDQPPEESGEVVPPPEESIVEDPPAENAAPQQAAGAPDEENGGGGLNPAVIIVPIVIVTAAGAYVVFRRVRRRPDGTLEEIAAGATEVEPGGTAVPAAGPDLDDLSARIVLLPRGRIAAKSTDLDRLRIAGAELREGLRPQSMDPRSMDEVPSADAFYEFVFRHTEIEPEGSFLSVNDFASPGGGPVFLPRQFATNYDNGALNFSAGDIWSAPHTVVGELGARAVPWGEIGFGGGGRWQFAGVDWTPRIIRFESDSPDFDLGQTLAHLDWSGFDEAGAAEIDTSFGVVGAQVWMLGPADDLGAPWVGFAATYENRDPVLVACPAAFGSEVAEKLHRADVLEYQMTATRLLGPRTGLDQAAITQTAVRVPIDVVPGLPGQAASDGRFGLALRYFEPGLSDTEFGFFWTHLHSRLPLLSAGPIPTSRYASTAEFFREFPDDLDTLGVSFDRPLQIDEIELLFSALMPLVPDQPASAYVGMPGRVYQLTDLATLEPQPNGTWRLPAGGEHQVVVPTGFVFVPDGELPDLYELMGQLPVASFGADGQARVDLSTGSGRFVVNVFDAIPSSTPDDASPRIKAASAYTVHQRTDRDFVSLTASYGF